MKFMTLPMLASLGFQSSDLLKLPRLPAVVVAELQPAMA
ncbi:hypothetical protein TIFTF001_017925 [Ficus carica]|uniref:Uncharacterized protein n=1 Tax=Ficus carica TaxID=3494 RepID=A0AA88DA96_FICCA|nr:hypothetical protein TIFTF001_017925 [Ficus carica]